MAPGIGRPCTSMLRWTIQESAVHGDPGRTKIRLLSRAPGAIRTPGTPARPLHPQVARPAIGDAWLFPAPGDPEQPASRHLVRDWWERAAKLADLPKCKRLGWHSLRRQWAKEMKETPLKDLCYMGGWKSPMTVLTCYQQPDTETQREALTKRKRYRAGAGG